MDNKRSNLITTYYKLQIIELDRFSGDVKHYITSYNGTALEIFTFLKHFLIIYPSYESDRERVLTAFDEFFN